ncbi:MAG: type III-B CRISPR module RAMP protein Cmr6 [Bacteroidota bacterium]
MNLHHQFYREYYRKLDPSHPESEKRKGLVKKYNQSRFSVINKRITEATLDKAAPANYLFDHPGFGPSLKKFRLQTTYPGLVCGTGYPHETGSADDEFKIGFYFDQTTGLPTIPGSSIKGTLRASFPRFEMINQKSKEHKSTKQAKADLITRCAATITENTTLKSWSKAGEKKANERLKWVNLLEHQIFDGLDPNLGKKRISPSKIDTCLAAQIAVSPGSQKPFLGTDYITPHGKEIWEEPTPILFLKVLPQVTFEFSFLLFDTIVSGIEFTAKHKRNLFRLLLLISGVGAKTNVGYGRLVDPKVSSKEWEKELEKIFPELSGDPDYTSDTAKEQPEDFVQDNKDSIEESPQPKAYTPTERDYKHASSLNNPRRGPKVTAKVYRVEREKVTYELLIKGLNDSKAKFVTVTQLTGTLPTEGTYGKIQISSYQSKKAKAHQFKLMGKFEPFQ